MSRPTSHTNKMLRMRGLVEMTGTPASTAYEQINDGLLPKPVALGGRNKGFPEHEIAAVMKARIAGKSDDFVRYLVKHLEAQRHCDDAELLSHADSPKREGE